MGWIGALFGLAQAGLKFFGSWLEAKEARKAEKRDLQYELMMAEQRRKEVIAEATKAQAEIMASESARASERLDALVLSILEGRVVMAKAAAEAEAKRPVAYIPVEAKGDQSTVMVALGIVAAAMLAGKK